MSCCPGPTQVEVRYRCVACSRPVKIGHVMLVSILAIGTVAVVRQEGHDEEEEDYLGLVCESCQALSPDALKAMMEHPGG